MAFRKLEVINFILTKHGEATYVELMALKAIDSIKADLLRLDRIHNARVERVLTQMNRAAA